MKLLPLDNSQAITESPQSEPPGFQVNPPVPANTRGQQMGRGTKRAPSSKLQPGGTQHQEKPSGCSVVTPSLPVNDNGVGGGFVSVATTFLVTASAEEESQRQVLEQTSQGGFNLPALGLCHTHLGRLGRGTLAKPTGICQAPIPHPAHGDTFLPPF